jgi:hypothetical protein
MHYKFSFLKPKFSHAKVSSRQYKLGHLILSLCGMHVYSPCFFPSNSMHFDSFLLEFLNSVQSFDYESLIVMAHRFVKPISCAHVQAVSFCTPQKKTGN